jgi:hypothetical protein
VLAHHQQRRDRGEERDRVQGEGPAGAERAEQHTAEGRADQAAQLERRRDHADRVPDPVLADQFGDERLPRRIVDSRGEPEEQRHHVDLPDLHLAGESQYGEDCGRCAHRRLGDQQDLPLREAVRDHPAVQAQQEGGEELQRGGDADGGGAAGDGEHQPVLGDALDPAAGRADQQSADQ